MSLWINPKNSTPSCFALSYSLLRCPLVALQEAGNRMPRDIGIKMMTGVTQKALGCGFRERIPTLPTAITLIPRVIAF
jgi:hypothetical protein